MKTIKIAGPWQKVKELWNPQSALPQEQQDAANVNLESMQQVIIKMREVSSYADNLQQAYNRLAAMTNTKLATEADKENIKAQAIQILTNYIEAIQKI